MEEVRKSWRKCLSDGLHICTVIKYYSSDQIKNDEMGGACGTYCGEEKCKQAFCEET
jgi:hypothetical protein